MKSEMKGQLIEEHLQDSESERHSRPVVLVFSDFYLPGYKSGGGMRTLVNIVDRFGDEYDFRIVTRDHDGKTDKTPYSNISYDLWVRVGKSLVRYLAKRQIRIGEINRIVKAVSPDALFFNSYFSTLTIFCLLLRRFGLLKRLPIVIAPQGELSDGALGLKQSKKREFLRFASIFRLYRDVVWRATSEIEAEEVERAKGRGGRVFVVADMSPVTLFPGFDPGLKPLKKTGAAKFIFFSRIHPKKNLTFLLELVAEIDGSLDLDIVGPFDADRAHLQKTLDLIETLPSNVRVSLVGEIEHERVFEVLADHHFFVLPTLSENFGHVFLEAMAAGCPLIISDRTPWRDLEKEGIGWDIPLEDRARWIEVLGQCIRMDQGSFSRMSLDARRFAENWTANDSVEKANRDVFDYALSLKKGV